MKIAFVKIANANLFPHADVIKFLLKVSEYILSGFHLSRSATSHPPPPPQHILNNQEVPINVFLRQAMVKMTIVRS